MAFSLMKIGQSVFNISGQVIDHHIKKINQMLLKR
jgi:hypothetical protein